MNNVRGKRPLMRLAICGPAWWASCGFAAIPTTMLDPPHGAASPMVPALIGSGSPYLTQALGVSAIGPSVSISAIF